MAPERTKRRIAVGVVLINPYRPEWDCRSAGVIWAGEPEYARLRSLHRKPNQGRDICPAILNSRVT